MEDAGDDHGVGVAQRLIAVLDVRQLRVHPLRVLDRGRVRQRDLRAETVQAHGVKRSGQTREVSDTPAVRGMVNTVKHLLEVQE